MARRRLGDFVLFGVFLDKRVKYGIGQHNVHRLSVIAGNHLSV
jgi:hypothetical protein